MKIVCVNCGKTKKHYAKGMCQDCYMHSPARKNAQRAYKKSDKWKAYQKTDKYKTYQKAYFKKVFEGYRRAKKAGLIK